MNDLKEQFAQYSDTEIIYKVLNGELKLYEILIRRYNSFLYKIGRSYHYNHQDTEDLMQETYISAYCNLKKFEQRASFKTWLTRLMLNHCYQKKHKLSYANEIVTAEPATEKTDSLFQFSNKDEMINKELGSVMENALLQIPEDYRMVFTLRELNGLSVAETAAALNITETNVKVRLNRAKAMLRSANENMYSPDEIFEFNLIYCDSMVHNVMSRIHELQKNQPL
jgi:RNA polymerase sigma-70 factor (ECF subfamily)